MTWRARALHTSDTHSHLCTEYRLIQVNLLTTSSAYYSYMGLISVYGGILTFALYNALAVLLSLSLRIYVYISIKSFQCMVMLILLQRYNLWVSAPCTPI